MFYFKLGLGAIALLGLVGCGGSPETKTTPQAIVPSPIASTSPPSPVASKSPEVVTSGFLFINKAEVFEIRPDQPLVLSTGIPQNKTMILEVDKGTLYTLTGTDGKIIRDYSNQEISDRQGTVVFSTQNVEAYKIILSVNSPKKVKISLRNS